MDVDFNLFGAGKQTNKQKKRQIFLVSETMDVKHS